MRYYLLDLPNIVSLKEFGEVVVLLLLRDLINLRPNSVIVGGSLDIPDDTESDGEVRSLHERKLKLESVILTMRVMDKDIVNGDTILTNLDYFETKAFLHQAKLLVLAKDERLAVLNIDGVELASLTAIDRVVCAIVEDDAVLENFANRGSFVLICCLENLNCAGGIRGHSACEEMPASAKAELCRAERILDCAIGGRLRDEAAG